jgi:hypothetical protein
LDLILLCLKITIIKNLIFKEFILNNTISTKLIAMVSATLLGGLTISAQANQPGAALAVQPAPAQAAPMQAPVPAYGYPYRGPRPMPYNNTPWGGNQYGGTPWGGNRYGNTPWGGNQFGGMPWGGNRYGNSPWGGNRFGGMPWGGNRKGFGNGMPFESNFTPWSERFWDDLGEGGRNPMRNMDGWFRPGDPKEGAAQMWDDMLNAPSDMGRMPGGWNAPSVSVPNPIDVADEFEKASRDVPGEMRDQMDNININTW